MKILLTGSSGFIGFHLARALLARGDEVIGVDSMNAYYDPALKERRNAILERERGYTFIKGDVCDRETVEKAIRGADRVCHLAAVAGVRYAFEDPEAYIRNNVVGFFTVLDSAVRNDIPGFIYASSSSVYGGNESLPSKETDRVDDPQSLYGENKRENELLAHTYHHLHGIPVTGLRYFTVYGPWGRPDMAAFIFTDAVLHGKPLRIFGEGKMQRDWTYIDDIVEGTVSAIDKNLDGEVFNLGSGRKEELMDFVATVEKACGREGEKNMLPMQPGDVVATSADITKAKTALGYEPKTMISEGIPKFVTWYREYHDV